MGKNHSSSAAFFLLLNILLFSVISASPCSCPPAPPKPKPTPKPTPRPSPKPTPSGAGKCPKDALQLGVCANVLGNLIKGLTILHPLNTPCCSLLSGIADLEAAVCLCTAIKANLLGINLNVPVSLSLLLNVCNKKVPPKFKC